ncbi:hypothetical protein [Nocardia cyriacigeorgica]|jgi:uncharacterized ion transporter superfamily protein YfcC|uniref:hypothetical protein n=1 Tax=Nocardia cyriacigeorgica TaxID=135487 RepID=UPI0002D8D179|nr:hypothetical protein [Nocardia cyriacigeorgica]
MSRAQTATEEPGGKQRKKFEFPGAVTVLAIVMVLVWLAALFIPAGEYRTDADGAPIPGSFDRVDSPLTFWERVQQLILAPVNGLYGLQDTTTGFVDTENMGRLFGSVGVVLFIMALGAFISVSFATRSLEVAVGGLGAKLQDKGWMLIAVIMVLFSVLGTTMGFSVETFGFYALIIPLMLAMGYDRMVAAARPSSSARSPERWPPRSIRSPSAWPPVRPGSRSATASCSGSCCGWCSPRSRWCS